MRGSGGGKDGKPSSGRLSRALQRGSNIENSHISSNSMNQSNLNTILSPIEVTTSSSSMNMIPWLRENLALAQKRSEELSSATTGTGMTSNSTPSRPDLSIYTRIHGQKASHVYNALSTILYTSLTLDQIGSLEAYIRSAAAALPCVLFDLEHWDHVLKMTMKIRQNSIEKMLNSMEISPDLSVKTKENTFSNEKLQKKLELCQFLAVNPVRNIREEIRMLRQGTLETFSVLQQNLMTTSSTIMEMLQQQQQQKQQQPMGMMDVKEQKINVKKQKEIEKEQEMRKEQELQLQQSIKELEMMKKKYQMNIETKDEELEKLKIEYEMKLQMKNEELEKFHRQNQIILQEKDEELKTIKVEYEKILKDHTEKMKITDDVQETPVEISVVSEVEDWRKKYEELLEEKSNLDRENESLRTGLDELAESHASLVEQLQQQLLDTASSVASPTVLYSPQALSAREQLSSRGPETDTPCEALDAELSTMRIALARAEAEVTSSRSELRVLRAAATTNSQEVATDSVSVQDVETSTDAVEYETDEQAKLKTLAESQIASLCTALAAEAENAQRLESTVRQLEHELHEAATALNESKLAFANLQQTMNSPRTRLALEDSSPRSSSPRLLLEASPIETATRTSSVSDVDVMRRLSKDIAVEVLDSAIHGLQVQDVKIIESSCTDEQRAQINEILPILSQHLLSLIQAVDCTQPYDFLTLTLNQVSSTISKINSWNWLPRPYTLGTIDEKSSSPLSLIPPLVEVTTSLMHFVNYFKSQILVLVDERTILLEKLQKSQEINHQSNQDGITPLSLAHFYAQHITYNAMVNSINSSIVSEGGLESGHLTTEISNEMLPFNISLSDSLLEESVISTQQTQRDEEQIQIPPEVLAAEDRIVRIQSAIRSFLAREGVKRMKLERLASESGVMVAMDGTEQGNPGWYSRGEDLFYFTSLNGDFVLLCGPISKSQYYGAAKEVMKELFETHGEEFLNALQQSAVTASNTDIPMAEEATSRPSSSTFPRAISRAMIRRMLETLPSDITIDRHALRATRLQIDTLLREIAARESMIDSLRESLLSTRAAFTSSNNPAAGEIARLQQTVTEYQLVIRALQRKIQTSSNNGSVIGVDLEDSIYNDLDGIQ